MDPLTRLLRLRDELSLLLEGDIVFCNEGGEGGGDGGGSSGDTPPGGEGATPPAGSADDPGGSGEEEGDGNEAISLEEARKLRREHAQLRKRTKEAEEKLADRERADLGEKERAERELADAQKRNAELETETRKLRVRFAAQDAGAIDPEAVAALLDWDALDDPDDERSLTRAVKEMQAKRPHLFGEKPDPKPKRESADAGAGRNGGGERSEVEARPGVGTLRRAYAETKS